MYGYYFYGAMPSADEPVNARYTFLSNHNIHKSRCRLYFWASDPLTKPHKLLWMLWFDEKCLLSCKLENSMALYQKKLLLRILIWDNWHRQYMSDSRWFLGKLNLRPILLFLRIIWKILTALVCWKRLEIYKKVFKKRLSWPLVVIVLGTLTSWGE